MPSSSLLPRTRHYNHGCWVHVHLGASFCPAAGFPEYDIPISPLLPKFFPAAILWTLPLRLSRPWAGEVDKAYRADTISRSLVTP